MSEGDSPRFPVVLSAGVTQDMADRVEAEGREDESQSAVVRRLIKEGLKQSDGESLRIRIVSVLVFLGVAGFPTLLAYNGSIQSAVAFLILIAVLDFIQSYRGGRTFIRM